MTRVVIIADEIGLNALPDAAGYLRQYVLDNRADNILEVQQRNGFEFRFELKKVKKVFFCTVTGKAYKKLDEPENILIN